VTKAVEGDEDIRDNGERYENEDFLENVDRKERREHPV
jgi:hypothetical protein